MTRRGASPAEVGLVCDLAVDADDVLPPQAEQVEALGAAPDVSWSDAAARHPITDHSEATLTVRTDKRSLRGRSHGVPPFRHKRRILFDGRAFGQRATGHIGPSVTCHAARFEMRVSFGRRGPSPSASTARNVATARVTVGCPELAAVVSARCLAVWSLAGRSAQHPRPGRTYRAPRTRRRRRTGYPAARICATLPAPPPGQRPGARCHAGSGPADIRRGARAPRRPRPRERGQP